MCLGHSTWLLPPSRSKLTFSSFSLVELIHKDNLGEFTPFANELRDPVTRRNVKNTVARVVKQEHLYFASVISVYDARANLDSVFYSESGPRCDSSVDTRREFHRDTSRDSTSSPRVNCYVLCAREVVSGCARTRAFW